MYFFEIYVFIERKNEISPRMSTIEWSCYFGIGTAFFSTVSIHFDICGYVKNIFLCDMQNIYKGEIIKFYIWWTRLNTYQNFYMDLVMDYKFNVRFVCKIIYYMVSNKTELLKRKIGIYME